MCRFLLHCNGKTTQVCLKRPLTFISLLPQVQQMLKQLGLGQNLLMNERADYKAVIDQHTFTTTYQNCPGPNFSKAILHLPDIISLGFSVFRTKQQTYGKFSAITQ